MIGNSPPHTIPAPDDRLEHLGRLAGGLAHDMNNLLTVIGAHVVSAASALEAGDDADARRDLADAASVVERAGRMTRGLLEAAALAKPAAQLVDLQRLIDALAPVLRSLVGGARKELLIVHDEQIPPVAGEPALIEQAIINLVLNARDAIEQDGRILLATSLSPEARSLPNAARGYAVISVVDDGVGFDEESLVRAFDPFFTTKHATGGTGLGLTAVREIAERHGGDVRIAGGPQGTRVEVWLPIAGPTPG